MRIDVNAESSEHAPPGADTRGQRALRVLVDKGDLGKLVLEAHVRDVARLPDAAALGLSPVAVDGEVVSVGTRAVAEPRMIEASGSRRVVCAWQPGIGWVDGMRARVRVAVRATASSEAMIDGEVSDDHVGAVVAAATIEATIFGRHERLAVSGRIAGVPPTLLSVTPDGAVRDVDGALNDALRAGGARSATARSWTFEAADGDELTSARLISKPFEASAHALLGLEPSHGVGGKAIATLASEWSFAVDVIDARVA